MDTTTVSDYQNPATPEEVWAILRENSLQLDKLREEHEKSQRETERFIKEFHESQKEAAERQAKWQEEYAKEQAERQKEAAKEQAERQKEREKERKEYEKEQKKYAKEQKEYEKEQKKKNDEFYERLGHFTNLFGELTEAMVAPKICEKFEEIGLIFPKANRNTRVNDRVNKISFEIDIMLENGEKAMLIEVKTKLTIERIKYHLNRLEKMRKYADLHGDKRAFLGAVAGIVVTDKARDYALQHGLYFIAYAGETFYITSPNGKPKEW